MKLGGGWEKRNSDSLAETYFLFACLQVGATNAGVCQMVLARSKMASLIGRVIFEEEDE